MDYFRKSAIVIEMGNGVKKRIFLQTMNQLSPKYW
jgi:hypothetical protein